jgi:hypothetical protein
MRSWWRREIDQKANEFRSGHVLLVLGQFTNFGYRLFKQFGHGWKYNISALVSDLLFTCWPCGF